jgi:glycosyltransferase involved in cell wall biosynthesis
VFSLSLKSLFRRIYRTLFPPTLRTAFYNFRRGYWGWPPATHLPMSPRSYVFDRYKRKRSVLYPSDLSELSCPCEPGLVSIVLPVYNGADYIREALDSVLAQSYPHFELIVINDGSTDGTSAIVDHYAQLDPRIRAIHQENRKVPRTLSRGFRMARGEFLTWISSDNRLKSEFLAQTVGCLRQHPNWDMIYANIDIIGENGVLLRDADEYQAYQRPPGSGHIFLPTDTSYLNTSHCYLGAAYLYRNRVAYLLGDYSPFRFTVEDYDYWMRINSFLNLRPADFDRQIYEYRYHRKSLTSQARLSNYMRIISLAQIFDDLRRDLALGPLIWFIDGNSQNCEVASRLRQQIQTAGHLLYYTGQFPLSYLPTFWVPAVYVRVLNGTDSIPEPPDDVPNWVFKVIVVLSANSLPKSVSASWDMCIAIGSQLTAHPLGKNYQGWFVTPSVDVLFTSIDIRVKSEHLRSFEAAAYEEQPSMYKASIALSLDDLDTTNQKLLASVAHQNFPHGEYEVLLVTANHALLLQGNELRDTLFPERPDQLRVFYCPHRPYADNVALAEAKGDIVCYVEDPVLSPDWLRKVVSALEAQPEAAIMSERVTHEATALSDQALFPQGPNWSARRHVLLEMGGFRTRYSRSVSRLTAAHLAKTLGYEAAVIQAAPNDIRVSRPRLKNICHEVDNEILGNYIVQRDLYAHADWGIKHTLRNLVKAPKTYRPASLVARLIEFWCYKWTYLRLLRLQLNDRREMVRVPLGANRKGDVKR